MSAQTLRQAQVHFHAGRIEQARLLLQRLLQRDPAHAEANHSMAVILVQQHVAVEEGEVFPAFRARAGAAEMDRLTREADRARGAAPSPPVEDAEGHAEARPSAKAATKAAATRAAGRKSTRRRFQSRKSAR